MTDILVLGGGYTGIAAAIRVAARTRRTGGEVRLVNASTRFMERLRLHQTVAGPPLREKARLQGAGSHGGRDAARQEPAAVPVRLSASAGQRR
ncbi:hypothetical protein ABZ897_05815 [Nonomuraea sp. NPDC046802]|uniref:hypothetical protein n=1 Tax=Nonomuraea sp. NPDC046802 TaxID=3154919 RepID=UPI00340385CB